MRRYVVVFGLYLGIVSLVKADKPTCDGVETTCFTFGAAGQYPGYCCKSYMNYPGFRVETAILALKNRRSHPLALNCGNLYDTNYDPVMGDYVCGATVIAYRQCGGATAVDTCYPTN